MKGHVPLLGRLQTLKDVKRGQLIRTWSAAAEEADALQAPMLRLAVGSKPFFVVRVDPSAIHSILKRPVYVRKGPQTYSIFNWLGWRSTTLINAETEDQHVHERKAFNAFFSQENIAAVVQFLIKEIASKCDQVLHAADEQPEGTAVVNMAQVAGDVIAAVVQQVFFETDTQVDMSTFNDQVELMGTALGNPFVESLLSARLHPDYWSRYRPNLRKLQQTWECLAREAYTRPMQEDSTAFWACVRRAYPDALTDSKQWLRAVSNISMIYAAGSETTVNAISIILAALAADEGSRHKLENELAEAGLLATHENAKPRQPSLEDLNNLPFLNAVFHEGLRVFPTAPNGTLRVLDRDFDTGKGSIPAGTAVAIPPWGVHRSTQAWGEDAAEWRPERWLEGRSIAAVRKDKHGAPRWLPFSDGRQNCIGQHIATIETKLALSMFVGRFHVRMAPQTPFTSVAELVDNTTSLVTLHQKEGVWLSLQPRVPANA